MIRWYRNMHRRLRARLFPATVEHEARQRAEKLRRDNARMQAALNQWGRCDDAAAYLARHHRSL